MNMMVSALSLTAGHGTATPLEHSSSVSASGADELLTIEEAKRTISASTETLFNAEENLVSLRKQFVEHMTKSAAYDQIADTDEEAGELSDNEADMAHELQKQSFEVKAFNSADALACCEWMREEFKSRYIEGEKIPDWMNIWHLKMLDNTLGVLRQIVTERAA